jgi:hypothetical protein
MQFSTINLLVAGLMAQGLLASPFTGEEARDLFEMNVEQREGGSIVTYGETKRSLAPRADCGGWFQPACPKTCKVVSKDTPECDDKNGGTNDVCNNLLNDLYGNSGVKLGSEARQICWKGADAKTGCCIKWTKAVDQLTKGDLTERAAESTQSTTLCSVSTLLISFC